MENWKKYWIRFAIGATVNAGVFVAYRLHIHKLRQEEKKEAEREAHNQSVKEDAQKIFKESTMEKLEKPALAEKKVRKPRKKKSVEE